MTKKIKNLIILLILLLILIGTYQATANNSDKIKKPTNFHEDNIQNNNIKKNHKNNYDEIYQTMTPIRIRTSNFSHNLSTYILTDLSQSFSWKNYNGKDWTTPARNQGNCGSCWLFSAIGTLEGVINIMESNADLDPDLSEQYVLSCMPEAGSCNGGDPYNSAFYYIMNTSEVGNYHNGVILEDCFNYESSFSYIPPCHEKCICWEEMLVPISNFYNEWVNINDPNHNDIMKSLIYQKGPILATYWVSDFHKIWGTYNHKSSKYYPDLNEQCPGYVNHGISIVGWKDDQSIPNGGYWICKNSWGTDWGYDGFFNLEYNCLNMGALIAWVEYNSSSFDWAPVADAGGFYKGEVGQEITFDASRSFDTEGEIILYEWYFGDETYDEGVSSTYIYFEPGIYKVELIVKDSGNKTSKDFALVGIDQQPINIEILSGIGLNIDIKNPSIYNLYNRSLSIELKGSLINMDYRNKIIDLIPANGEYSFALPLIGFGRGTINFSLDNFSITKQIFMIGPLIIVIKSNFS